MGGLVSSRGRIHSTETRRALITDRDRGIIPTPIPQQMVSYHELKHVLNFVNTYF